MPLFCDVAVAVPLDMAFTYSIPDGTNPVLGGRVLVPFRQQRMSGIVVDLHDRPPSVKTKNILQVLDSSPVLSDQLLRLGRWIADYYLAPIGEVFRACFRPGIRSPKLPHTEQGTRLCTRWRVRIFWALATHTRGAADGVRVLDWLNETDRRAFAAVLRTAPVGWC
jgi:primosomal protein N'